MSRRMTTPSYRLHKPSGQAVVTLDGRDIYLGNHDTPESKAEYDRLIAEWLANGRRLPSQRGGQAASDLSVNELLARYWKHAEQHYRLPTGEPSDELPCIRSALRPLRELYGHTPAGAFGPLALKAVRLKMVETIGPTGQPWSRGFVNASVRRIKAVFKWGVENEMVPAPVYHALLAVAGLQRGRTAARETEPTTPVADAVVEATLPFTRQQVAAMVQLQRHSGMRPGEVVILRGLDLDTTGAVWLYRPGSDQGPHGRHKTAWRGHSKVIALGPKAQAILKPWLRLNLTEYLFQPREAVAALRAEQRQTRKTRVQPSQKDRSKTKPKKKPGERYTSRSYAHAIVRAIEKANTARACEACKPKKPAERCEACKATALPHWHPHQLRHTHATEVRRQFGLEAAQVALGHSSADVTQVYAERNLALAVQVAAQIG